MLRGEHSAQLRIASFMKSKSRLYKHRQKIFPVQPKHRKDIVIPDEWKLTLDRSETFLLVDDGIDDRILVNMYKCGHF